MIVVVMVVVVRDKWLEFYLVFLSLIFTPFEQGIFPLTWKLHQSAVPQSL